MTGIKLRRGQARNDLRLSSTSWTWPARFVLAQKGNLARGIKPDLDTAKRLEAALDYFISEQDGQAAGGKIGGAQPKAKER
jgi:hypothetical protein